MGLNLVFLGPPGVGKGTQAELIASARSLAHLSTGAMLRAAVEAGSPTGKQADGYMQRGKLVPDDTVIEIVRDRLHATDTVAGFILDGFPRTEAQAEALDAVLDEAGRPLTRVVNFTAPETVLVARLLARGRDDDNESTIRTRLVTYHAQTEPLIQYYKERDLLTEVQASATIEIVHETTAKVIDRLAGHGRASP